MKNKMEQHYTEDDNENNIFILGIVVLFAWMFVIILCASPQVIY